jgi:ppGpp synthetase/RelA/SpoT-type nucleotidyltranferase
MRANRWKSGDIRENLFCSQKRHGVAFFLPRSASLPANILDKSYVFHYSSIMAWASRQFDLDVVNRAGKAFIQLPRWDPEREAALQVINNWRSCHSFPLHIIAKTLSTRARTKVSADALTARRIKRLSSIAIKLQQNSTMRLTQMQDIGGCRAVLNSVSDVEELVKVYEKAKAKQPNTTDRPMLYSKSDYISKPKLDGYRGVHLIMKYQSGTKSEYNGQKIEIQIRSALQHAWATSVETCQTFTGQALKSKIKKASDTWLRFFALMSSAIALREKRPIVPGTPDDRAKLRDELSAIERYEKIIMLLSGWNEAMQHQESVEEGNSAAFILKLDTEQRSLSITPFTKDEMLFADAKYLEMEKETEGNSNIQVVLVSADSVAALRRAYPNYYVDTTAFIEAIQQEIY